MKGMFDKLHDQIQIIVFTKAFIDLANEALITIAYGHYYIHECNYVCILLSSSLKSSEVENFCGIKL